MIPVFLMVELTNCLLLQQKCCQTCFQQRAHNHSKLMLLKTPPPDHKLVCCAAIPGNGKFKTSDESQAINGTRRMHRAWHRAGGQDYHTCPNVQPWKKTPSPIGAIWRDTTRSKWCMISVDTLAWFG